MVSMIHCSRLKLRLHDPTPAAAPLSPFLDLDLSSANSSWSNIRDLKMRPSSKYALSAQVGVHKAPVQQQIASGTVYRGISSVCYGMSELWT